MRYLFILLVFFFLGACNERNIEPIDLDYGYEYYPVRIGASWTYAIDSLIFDPGLSGTDTLRTQSFIREVVVDTMVSGMGTTQFRVEQSWRATDSSDWQIVKVLSLEREEQRAIRTEDNLRYVKLTFPVETGNSWDGNAFFDPETNIVVAGEQIAFFKNWSYQILSFDEVIQLGDLSLENVVSVQNADDENLIERRYALEQYAKNIGLVYRVLNILDTQCEVCCNGDFALCEGLSWVAKAEKGIIIEQVLIDYE
jgi:hypothetical protein